MNLFKLIHTKELGGNTMALAILLQVLCDALSLAHMAKGENFGQEQGSRRLQSTNEVGKLLATLHVLRPTNCSSNASRHAGCVRRQQTIWMFTWPVWEPYRTKTSWAAILLGLAVGLALGNDQSNQSAYHFCQFSS